MRVTETEYAAIRELVAAGERCADPEYVPTTADAAAREAGAAAYVAAWERHNAWHDAWTAAPTLSERHRIECECDDAEHGMRSVSRRWVEQARRVADHLRRVGA